MDTVRLINTIIGVLFCVCYAYQGFFVIAALVTMFRRRAKKQPPHEPSRLRRFGIMIPARNESVVIGELIRTIKEQRYPAELVTIFVIADNCTDNTAQVARDAGAVVYERTNRELVGKGYALDYLLAHIHEDYGDAFDGYIVFDSDNILDPNYIAEMNRTVDQGFEICTSYRNSKNYGDNWISAGYGLSYLRESRFLNFPRMLLHTTCAISGTGFYVSRELIEKEGGWKYFLLTEDIQFTVSHVLDGYKVGFSEGSILYDEQPVKFSQSWNQRLRWSKGFLQVWSHYGKRLLRNLFSSSKFFSVFDMTMTVLPALYLTAFFIFVNIIAEIVGLFIGVQPELLWTSIWVGLRNSYLTFFALGLVTTISEWKVIHCSTVRKILYMFTFPLFMLTYVPIATVAVFKKVQWKPIQHSTAGKNFLKDVSRSGDSEDADASAENENRS